MRSNRVEGKGEKGEGKREREKERKWYNMREKVDDEEKNMTGRKENHALNRWIKDCIVVSI